MGPPDADLVERFQRGDRGAFDLLVERYVRMAGAAAYAVLGDYEQAADCVQDAFLKIHGAIHDLREPGKFKPWMHGVVRSSALDALRRRKRAPGSLSAVDGAESILPAPAADPAAGLARSELEGGVLAAIRELPEQYREVVLMKYVSDRSYKEISEALGLSVETIESRLFRARKLLKEKLESYT